MYVRKRATSSFNSIREHRRLQWEASLYQLATTPRSRLSHRYICVTSSFLRQAQFSSFNRLDPALSVEGRIAGTCLPKGDMSTHNHRIMLLLLFTQFDASLRRTTQIALILALTTLEPLCKPYKERVLNKLIDLQCILQLALFHQRENERTDKRVSHTPTQVVECAINLHCLCNALEIQIELIARNQCIGIRYSFHVCV